MKIFNLLDFGERAGSGVPNILQTWEAQNWASPQVEEQYGPDRTRLTLALTNIGGQDVRQDVRQESIDDKIENLIRNNPSITAKEMAEHFKVNEKTIRRHIKKWIISIISAGDQMVTGKSLMKSKNILPVRQ